MSERCREERKTPGMAKITLATSYDRIKELVDNGRFADPAGAEDLVQYLDQLRRELPSAENWAAVPTFWPPRCVRGIQAGEGVIFFGAGLSMPCNVPSWSALLENTFGLEPTLVHDDDLATDPLTLAELAGEHVGHEALQGLLRRVMQARRPFSVSHALIALLDCPAYITTNYDSLFEDAWAAVRNDVAPLHIVTNDGDLPVPDGSTPLYKIHGDAAKTDEHLILTRRDYRMHYRANTELFARIRDHLTRNQMIFVGFSHKDPEVSRLVEDVIYEYERPSTRPPTGTDTDTDTDVARSRAHCAGSDARDEPGTAQRRRTDIGGRTCAARHPAGHVLARNSIVGLAGAYPPAKGGSTSTWACRPTYSVRSRAACPSINTVETASTLASRSRSAPNCSTSSATVTSKSASTVSSETPAASAAPAK